MHCYDVVAGANDEGGKTFIVSVGVRLYSTLC